MNAEAQPPFPARSTLQHPGKKGPGLLLSAAIALLALAVAQWSWLQAHGVSALTLAIVFGMVLGNTLYPAIDRLAGSGVAFCKSPLLRAGIVLYGLRLSFQDIANVGLRGIAADALVLSTTFTLAWLVGTRLLRLDRNTALLIGAGSSICGAAAVMATAPVLHSRAEQVAVAVASVVVFGTLAMFGYPLLYRLGIDHGWLTMSPQHYGLYVGSTVHEVAQVYAAGRAIGAEAADTAVIVKMVRVMMLAPFLIVLPWWLARRDRRHGAVVRSQNQRIIPWFAFGFIAMSGFSSLHVLATPLLRVVNGIDTVLLAMAMSALGLSTHASALRQAGPRPLLLGGVLLVWLLLGGFVINLGVQGWLD